MSIAKRSFIKNCIQHIRIVELWEDIKDIARSARVSRVYGTIIRIATNKLFQRVLLNKELGKMHNNIKNSYRYNICSHSSVMPVTGVEPVRVLLPTGF